MFGNLANKEPFSINPGERHYGTFKQMKAMGDIQLEKAIKSYKRNAKEHIEKVKNPKISYGDKWNEMSESHKKSAIKHWQDEIQNFTEQAEIGEKLQKERGL